MFISRPDVRTSVEPQLSITAKKRLQTAKPATEARTFCSMYKMLAIQNIRNTVSMTHFVE